DLLHAEQKQQLENKQAAELICSKMEHLASHEWRHESRAQYSVWCQRWAALDFAPDDEVVKRYGKAEAVVADIIERESLIETVHQQQENLASMLGQNCAELANLSKKQLLDQQPLLSQTLDGARQQWDSLIETDSAEPAVAAQFARAAEALTTVLEFCSGIAEDSAHQVNVLESSLATLQWPESYPALLAKQQIQSEIEELKAESRRAKQDAARKLDKLHKRINRLLGSTKRGDLKRAKRELAAVNKAAQRYSGKDKKALDERLVQASEAVDKMSDWVDFATEPKFLELCEAMESLIGSKLHADKLAARIGELQKSWKALGHSESADQHWERFKTAGDKAYAPCERFFQERQELRKNNLANREPLVRQMRELLEGTAWEESPDYRRVESELARIHNAWQKIKDVERGPGQKQWKRISKLRSAIYEKMDAIYDANIEMKNQLIEKVAAMLEGEIKEDSLAKLQLYQKRWKQVGVTRRKQDQAAWKKFKKASDAVFQQIQGLRKAKRADEDAQLDGYRQICREIKHLAKTATDLSEADSAFDKLQSDYKSLPPLPRGLPEKLIKGIAGDYRRSCDDYSNARERIKHTARAKTLDALTSKAALCAKLEKLSADGTSAKIEQLQQALADIEIDDKGLARRIDERSAAALNNDRSEANKRRQLLCIDLEILLGVDSPAEDASLRTQVQLERLKKYGIG
ncbi:MAG: DUF349 domain-containing protein, partial [Pseudomonadales bacterium]|nr:DUF349 domain-containing protein [Pseudomonadales bacterium]